MRGKRDGFTLVELLIVIVVIAILATISAVAYNGIQERARDARRQSDISKIVQAVQLWSYSTGKNFETFKAGGGTGEGLMGEWSGWYDRKYPSYPSVQEALISAGYLNEGVNDPLNSKSGEIYAYMIAPCTSATKSTQRVIMARLELPPKETLTQQLGVACDDGYYTTFTGSYYKMNYAKIIDIGG